MRARVGAYACVLAGAGSRRGDRGWLSHGLFVTLPISYSLDGGTLWGFTRDMRIADGTTSFANFSF